MVSAEEILKSLEEQMKDTENLYTEKVKELDVTVTTYQSEIKRLQEEGNAKIKQLEETIQQLRGVYTGLKNQYDKFAQVEEKKEEPKEDKKEVKVEEKPAKETKPKTKKANVPKENTLTPEEMEILQSVSDKTKDSKGNEIPDYLQEEYNQ